MASGTGRSLRAGSMNQRILFRTPNRASDHGFATVDYVDAFSVWADYTLGAGVFEQTQDRGAWKVQVDFDVRYRTDITPDMRIVWRWKTFEIEAIGPEHDLGRMTIRCIEESAP